MNKQAENRLPGKIPIWKVIAGHGAHIKATREFLIIQHRGQVSEIPLSDLDHLLIIGGHHIQTSAIATLINRNIFISFFESDGEPAGYLIPYRYRGVEIQQVKKNTAPYSYALSCAKEAARERILAIEQWNEEKEGGLLFSGELDILDQASREFDNYIKIEEIQRVDRLIGDMYYEILSRLISPALQFRQRTHRPYQDPVNTILTFGYTMLTASCTRALVGLHLDPDDGMLNRGKRSLTLDLCNCWKTRMIDIPALELLTGKTFGPESYECGEKRCILSESFIRQLITVYQQNIRNDIIILQAENFFRSLVGESGFEIIRY
jgi:CRISP-associated protein Cas1